MSAPQDPRRGVPSASAIGRIEACPASHQMALLAGDNSGKWSKFGDAIHEALATGEASKLDAAQMETFEMCNEQLERMLSEWAGDNEIIAIHRDSKRLGLTTIGGVVEVADETTAKLVNTGLSDVIALKFSKADQALHFFIADYKTLRGEVPEAADNAQLRNLAVLVAKRFRCVAGRVCVIQPWAGKPTLADFDTGLLRGASEWLDTVLHRERHATPDDRKAGVHCHYCPANATCSTFRQLATSPVEAMTRVLPQDGKTARAALFARAMGLDADTLAGFVKHLRLVGWWCAAIEGAAKRRAESDVEFQRYFRLADGNEVREVTDAQAAFNLALSQGVTPEQFMAECVKVTVGNLENVIRRASGPKITKAGKPHASQMRLSADEATKFVNTLLATGAMQMKKNAQQLEEVE